MTLFTLVNQKLSLKVIKDQFRSGICIHNRGPGSRGPCSGNPAPGLGVIKKCGIGSEPCFRS